MNICVNTCRVQNPDIPRADRVGAHGGAAERARAGLGANRTVRPENKALVPSKASNTRRLNVPPEARTSEILCKSNAGSKSAVDNRFITGLSAAYQRDRERSSFLAADQLKESVKFQTHSD